MRACALGQFRMTDERNWANYPGSFREREKIPQCFSSAPQPVLIQQPTATEQVIALVPGYRGGRFSGATCRASKAF